MKSIPKILDALKSAGIVITVDDLVHLDQLHSQVLGVCAREGVDPELVKAAFAAGAHHNPREYAESRPPYVDEL